MGRNCSIPDIIPYNRVETEREMPKLEIGILCRIMLSTLTVSWKGLISKLDSLVATFLIWQRDSPDHNNLIVGSCHGC